MPLTRSELELFAAHAEALYSIEVVRAVAPDKLVLTSEGVEHFATYMAHLAAKNLSGSSARFLDGRTVDELKDLVNKFQVLKGKPTL